MFNIYSFRILFVHGEVVQELYHLQFCSDIEIKVLIQEEDFGSLFSKPKFLVKPKAFPNLWLEKDENWFIEAISEKEKIKRIHTTEVISFTNLDNNLDILPTIFNLIHEASIIVHNYEWDHFTNIGVIKTSPLWKCYQDEDQKNTKERVWIASLSEQNYLETLSYMCPQFQINPMSLKKMIIEKKQERLHKELAKNPQSSKKCIKV